MIQNLADQCTFFVIKINSNTDWEVYRIQTVDCVHSFEWGLFGTNIGIESKTYDNIVHLGTHTHMQTCTTNP